MKNRKDEHLDLARILYSNKSKNDYDDIRFVHNSFPQLAFNDISISTKIAGLFLKSLMAEGVEETIELIESFKTQIKTIMAILGKTNIDDLVTAEYIITGSVNEWCKIRNI